MILDRDTKMLEENMMEVKEEDLGCQKRQKQVKDVKMQLGEDGNGNM